MPKIDRENRIYGTVIPGVVVVLLVLIALWVSSCSFVPFTKVLARTESVTANVTKVETAGAGFTVSYHFDYRNRQQFGETYTEMASLIEDARKTETVIVWFEPNDPSNSGVKQPSPLGWLLVAAPYLFIILLIVVYLIYLDDLLGWGIVKKQPKPEEG